MNADENPADGEFTSEAEFTERMKQDPAFREILRKGHGEAPTLPGGLEAMRHLRGAMLCKESLQRIMDVVHSAHFTPGPAELRSLIAQADEAVDHLLDVREPERSRMMATLLHVREDLRKILAGM